MISAAATFKSAAVPATFRCRVCGTEQRFMDNPAFAAFRPTVCDACEAARLEQEARRERKRLALASVPYPNWDPARGNDRTLQTVLANTQKGGSLVISGETGTGKTRALCQAVIRAVKAGRSVQWRNCGEWLDLMAAMCGRDMTEYVKAKAAAVQDDILVLDDLGKGKATERTASAVFDIVDKAIRVNCALWITTNHTAQFLEGKFGAEYGAPLVRRLVEVCGYVEVSP